MAADTILDLESNCITSSESDEDLHNDKNPFLDPPSSTSSFSSATSFSSVDAKKHNFAPLQWTDADLSYLLSCLYPDLFLHSQLSFSPPLKVLHDVPAPFHLKLMARLPAYTIQREAYSKHAPIGTGRPRLTYTIAESNALCYTPAEARASLAISIIKGWEAVNGIAARFKVLGILFSCTSAMLLSLKRGMWAMANASENERAGRRWQLRSVDEHCQLEPRIEAFLLQAGVEETPAWLRVVEMGLGMYEEEREEYAKSYGDAGAFLGLALASVLE